MNKKHIIIFFLSYVVLIAQYNPENHVVTFSKSYSQYNEDGTTKDWLEKNKEYFTKMNPLDKELVSSMVLTHRWSGSSKETIEMAEWKSIADADKSILSRADRMKKAWPNDKKREDFFNGYNKYYTGKHSDVGVMELNTARLKRNNKQISENSIVTIMEYYWKPISQVENGSAKERKELWDEFFDKVTMKNNKILTSMELHHYWTGSLGGGPRPVIFLVEYANIIDADNTGINNGTIMKAWPGEDERREFFQKRNKYIDWGHKDIGLYVNRVKWNKR